MKTFLVTGGAGFIGSNFILWLLQKEPDIRLINLDALTYAGSLENLKDLPDPDRHIFVKGDICDRPLIDQLLYDYQIDTIVHFAAETHVDRSILGPEQFIQTNVMGTFTLLEAAKHRSLTNPESNPFHFHHVSTDEVFGALTPDDPPFSEKTPYAPNSPYAASKAASDHLVRAYSHTYGLRYTMTNCSNNYGPHQFPEKLIPLMIRNAWQGQKLPVYGKGQNVRDWLYVEDNCKAIASVIDRGQVGSVYNIGAGEERPNLEVVELICELLAIRLNKPAGELKELIEFVKDRPGHDFRYSLESRRIRTELGWEPTVGLEEGLARTIDWYLCHQEWVNNVVSGEYKQYYHRVYEKGWQ